MDIPVAPTKSDAAARSAFIACNRASRSPFFEELHLTSFVTSYDSYVGSREKIQRSLNYSVCLKLGNYGNLWETHKNLRPLLLSGHLVLKSERAELHCQKMLSKHSPNSDLIVIFCGCTSFPLAGGAKEPFGSEKSNWTTVTSVGRLFFSPENISSIAGRCKLVHSDTLAIPPYRIKAEIVLSQHRDALEYVPFQDS